MHWRSASAGHLCSVHAAWGPSLHSQSASGSSTPNRGPSFLTLATLIDQSQVGVREGGGAVLTLVGDCFWPVSNAEPLILCAWISSKTADRRRSRKSFRPRNCRELACNTSAHPR